MTWGQTSAVEGAGSSVEAWDVDLDALAGISSAGLLAHTGAGTAAARTLQSASAGLTWTNGDGAGGNPTPVFANDLAALEALATTGRPIRTGADAWALLALSSRTWEAPDFDEPVTADWAVNANAPAAVHSVKSGRTERLFDDTAEEGVGFSVRLLSQCTTLTFKPVTRGVTAPGAARTMAYKVYARQMTDNAGWGAWTAGNSLADVDIPTNAHGQEDSLVASLATLGLTAGKLTQFQMTRVNPAAGTELVGDSGLEELVLEQW